MKIMSSFHYDFILSKRSSLAKVWLAAHWEKKLSKVQIFETNLQSSVHDILHPTTPIALRTSSHLLVGLVRIYSRKAKYLLADCSEALVNIKVAFRPGVVPVFEKQKKKKCAQDIIDCPFLITESVDLLDQWIPEVSNAEIDCSLNQSKIEEITIQEEPMKVSSLEDYFDDEGFGDMFDSDITEQESEKGETVFSRIYSLTDSDSVMEDVFSYDSSSVTDFSDPFQLFTPVKLTDGIEKLKDTTLAENEKPLPKFTLKLDKEMSEVRKSPELQHVIRKLDIEMDNSHANDMEIILDPAVKMPTKPSRKSLKRKLLIDSEISIDREEYLLQINNVSRLCRPPVMAAATKHQMRHISQDVESLFSLHNKSVWPHLQEMFQCSKVKNNSTSSNFVEERIAFSDTNENDEEVFDSVFIPLQDVEYSSDEDEVANTFHEHLNSCPASIEDAALLSTEQGEDISHDQFCSFVETTVLKSHPDPVNFQQVLSNSTPTRKNVARKFMKCLLMQRDARLQLAQVSNFSEIYLNSGNKQVLLPLECC